MTSSIQNNNPVIAHRGAWKKKGFPENSIASLQEAIRLQCAGSEFDVWMTADDSLVIHHDPEIDKIDIERSTYETLRQHKLSNGEPLPTLREYIKAGLHNNKVTKLVLEIKPSRVSKERGEKVAENVVHLINELQAARETVYISFDYGILKKILAIAPTAITQYLTGDKSPEEIYKDGISGIDYHYSVFRKNPHWIAEAKQQKLILNAWTVNDTTDMQWLLENKFDFITTNEPELLAQIIKQRGHY